ncbi:MAG: RHS repeat-associated core domain-containing protein [Bacteroidota bacterium]
MGAGEQCYRYNGKEYQDQLGLYDYGARWYDPAIARWNAVDPLADHPNLLSWSPYQYTYNNPIFYNDPTGECPDCWEFLKGFVKGIANAGLASAQGVADMQTPSGRVKMLAPIVADPKGAAIAIKDNLVETGKQITSGDPAQVGEGAGKATVVLVEAFAGSKGLTKLTKASSAANTTKNVGNASAKLPVGKPGAPMDINTPNTPATILDRKFTGHALDRMQERGITSPTAVDDAIRNPTSTEPGNFPGTTVHWKDNLKVVVNKAGDVITAVKKKRKK